MIKVGIFLPNHFTASVATTIYDYLNTSNLVVNKKVFDVNFISHQKSAISYSGISYKTLHELPRQLDMLIIIGTGGANKDEIFLNLKNQSAQIKSVILSARKSGAIVATCCTAAYYLADSGLLKNRLATSAWWLIDDMKKNFPDVDWDGRKNIVSYGKIITTAAGFSGVELAKIILTKFKMTTVDRIVQRILLLPERSTEQHPYIALTKNISNDFSKSLNKILSDNSFEVLSPVFLAEKMSMSSRTFLRKFKGYMGMTPAKWLQLKRIDRAKELLMTCDISIEETCRKVGYEDASTFSQLFQREVGVAPSEFRLTFRK